MLEITENVILIRINRLYHESLSSEALYEATRGVWVIGSRRDRVELALSVYKGEIKEVYQVSSWHPAGSTLYNSRPVKELKRDGRWEFIGCVANDTIRRKYNGQSVADYFPNGSANPIKYVNC